MSDYQVRGLSNKQKSGCGIQLLSSLSCTVHSKRIEMALKSDPKCASVMAALSLIAKTSEQLKWFSLFLAGMPLSAKFFDRSIWLDGLLHVRAILLYNRFKTLDNNALMNDVGELA